MGNKLRNGNLAATTICFLFVLQWTVNPRVASSSLATGAIQMVARTKKPL